MTSTVFPLELFTHWEGPFSVDDMNLFVLQGRGFLMAACRMPDSNELIPRGWGGISYLTNAEAIFDTWDAWFKEQNFKSLEEIRDSLNELWSEYEKNSPFLCRASKYANSLRGFRPISIKEIAPGLVLVHDSANEFDTYFDPELWEAIHPEVWKDALFPAGVKAINMGVLPSAGSAPPPTTHEAAVHFAKTQLREK